MDNLTVSDLRHILNMLSDSIAEVPTIFVETGSYKGDTISPMAASGLFEKVVTIEIDRRFANITKYRLQREAPDGNWVVVNGDSKRVMPSLCDHIHVPAIFYLDAHWSAGNLACRGKEPTEHPLMVELDAVFKRNKSDIIIIDDLRCFGQYTKRIGNWSNITIASILHKAGVSLPHSSSGIVTAPRHIIQNDRLCIKMERVKT